MSIYSEDNELEKLLTESYSKTLNKSYLACNRDQKMSILRFYFGELQ